MITATRTIGIKLTKGKQGKKAGGGKKLGSLGLGNGKGKIVPVLSTRVKEQGGREVGKSRRIASVIGQKR